MPPLAVLINEVAWSGTHASANDEWIELHNLGPGELELAGWTLTDGGDIHVSLDGSIEAYGYYLLERTDDTTVADIGADQIYTGSLRNSGEQLELRGPGGELIDSANADGGGWPAGDADSRFSMERRGGSDLGGNWASFTGYGGNGLDADGHWIGGTPRRSNSLFVPTPTPTALPSRIVINEVLIRPHHDWEGSGGVTTADEFIELYNAGRLPVSLDGWYLDDGSGTGSSPYELNGTIAGRSYDIFFRSETKIALNDGGDTVRLLTPDGRVADQISYLPVRAYNLSFGRLPDGSDNLSYGLWPTPRRSNLLYQEPLPELPTGPFYPWVCEGTEWLAGGQIVRASMERLAPIDNPAGWAAFVGPWSGGRDADGNRLSGTPGGPNSVWAALARQFGDSEPISPQSASSSPSPVANAESGLPASGAAWPSVIISEIAWRGGRASSADEWIELMNTGEQPIDLNGWLLSDGNDIGILLEGTLAPHAFYLLERDDDSAVSDLPASQVYSGSLNDAGEILWLLDRAGQIIDSANAVRTGSPRALLTRAARSPAQFAWMHDLELVSCGS